MDNIKAFLWTFVRPAGHIFLTSAMIIIWWFGIWLGKSGWSELCTSFAIAILLYLLVEGAGKLDNTQKQRHLREILLMAATVPAAKRESILEQQELQKYTGEVLDRYLNSLSQCQFYEKLTVKCDITSEKMRCPAAGGHVGKKFVKTEADVDIILRRFGSAPFVIEVGIDNATEVDVKYIIMGDEEFQKDVDYGTVKSDSPAGCSLKVEFKNDRWKRHDQATVGYKMMYYEFDHWTHFSWVARYPVRSMAVDFRCHDGLSKKDFVDTCEIPARITCREENDGHCEVITVGWLMPGHGFSVIFSDTEKDLYSGCSVVEDDKAKESANDLG